MQVVVRSIVRIFALVLIASSVAHARPAGKSAAPSPVAMAQATQYGMMIGNPKAKSRIGLFASYTCPHCAHFEAEGMTALLNGWVATGKANVEIRSIVTNRYDLTAALLARCGGAKRFLGNHRAIFAQQSPWLARLKAYESANPPSAATPIATQLRDIADKTGLTDLMTKRGYTRPQLATCIADERALQTLTGSTQDALQRVGVTGTPSFTIDGVLTGAHDWKLLHDILP